MRLSSAASEMRFRIFGRSRFIGHSLELELSAATADEAVAKARRLGLTNIEAKPLATPSTSPPQKR